MACSNKSVHSDNRPNQVPPSDFIGFPTTLDELFKKD